MRKSTLLIILAAIVTITACIKEKDNVVPRSDDDNGIDSPIVVPPKPVANNGITVSGVSDINVGLYGSRVLDVNVKCDSCKGNEIFLSVEGQHTRLKTTISKESGFSDYNSTIKTVSSFAKPGKYPVTIIASTRKGQKVTYNKNIVVDNVTKGKCNEFFDWAWHSGSAVVKLVSFSGQAVDSQIANGLFIRNNHKEENLYFWQLTLAGNYNGRTPYYSNVTQSLYHVLFTFDCNTATATIPRQIIRGVPIGTGNAKFFTIEGTGKLNVDSNTFEFDYTSTYSDGGSNIVERFKVTKDLRKL